MDKFQTFTGIAAPFDRDNVDTDLIIPARFLKTIKRTGLGKDLFNAIRYNDDGSEKPDFILNKEPYRKAEILISADNFGCGSSREHAPWALKDFGIKVVIAESFADIFYNNSFKNGILLVKLDRKTIEDLLDDAQMGANARLTVDLENQEIARPNGEKVSFELDPFLKECLLEGLDDIALTMARAPQIDDFEGDDRARRPWLYGDAPAA
ncbi:MAG: 3-isopropylmalate dehydratase small subunit [Acetobacterales bacterium]